MNIESLISLKYDRDTDLFNLFEPSFTIPNNVELFEYIVTREDEMRIDLIFKNVYQLDMSMLHNYIKDVDILLYINNIDNPLNIKEGSLVRYPIIGALSSFRFNSSLEDMSGDLIKSLSVPNLPNKITKVDRNRKKYMESEYSISPVISYKSSEPVRIENGKFTIGGINN